MSVAVERPGIEPAATSGAEPPIRFKERLTPRQLLGNAIVYAVLVAIGILYIYPFLIEIFTSFKTEADATANAISLIPPTWSTAAYQQLFVNSAFPTWFGNSVIVTVFVTAGRVFFDSIAGYATTRATPPRRGTRSMSASGPRNGVDDAAV